MQDSKENIFGEVIYRYTREQAIEDGVLVDVSAMAREAGIKYPVAITSAVYDEYVVPNEALTRYGQSIEGRLWDLLWMFTWGARKTRSDMLMFRVSFIVPGERGPKTVTTTFKAVCGPGDSGEPVITIMGMDED